MFSDSGKRVKKTEPATPVKILGLNAIPKAGDKFAVVTNEREARALAQKQQQERQQELLRPAKIPRLDDLLSQIREGQTKELNLILKTDVQGSIEPIKNSLERLETEEVKVKIIHSGSGNITEGDVLLALASKGIIIGFNTEPTLGAQRLAELDKVDIRHYTIIYDLIEDMERALRGMKEPSYVEVIEGHAEVRVLFPSDRYKKVAGVYISDGRAIRDASVRVMRQNQIVHQGSLGSLKRFKEDAKEVSAGFECGMGIEGFDQFKIGDVIEVYRKEKIDEAAH
jgi:translation initiation factor IF-2